MAELPSFPSLWKASNRKLGLFKVIFRKSIACCSIWAVCGACTTLVKVPMKAFYSLLKVKFVYPSESIVVGCTVHIKVADVSSLI